MANYDTAFSTPAAASYIFGQEAKVTFASSWSEGQSWRLDFTATVTGDFTLGKGNLASITPTAGFRFRNRIYLAGAYKFLFSANGDPTLWEDQDPGAGTVDFLSQSGTEDTVSAFGSFQNRLVVFGRKNSQIWQVDSDPNNFALLQSLEDTGTVAPLSVQGLGDLDVLFLDRTGIRSIRTKEANLNAYVSDVGTPIDSLIRAEILAGDETAACAIIEPNTKQYWLYINGTIYVLAQHPHSDIRAWSTFKPTSEVALSASGSNYSGAGTLSYSGNLVVGGIYYWTKGANDSSITNGSQLLSASGGFVATATSASLLGSPSAAYTGTLVRVDTAFTPVKFVTFNGQVYARGSDNKIYRYGGSDGNTYDHCRATVELPWLDLGKPSMSKQVNGLDVAIKGNWDVSASINPRTSAYTTVISRGSSTSPSVVEDSTFDVGHFPFSGYGTHIKVKAVSGIAATVAKLGKISVVYESGATK